MRFHIFLFSMMLLIPLSLIIMGKLFMKRTPGGINYLFGYRTPMSMKNRDTWEFAHAHYGRNAYKIGWMLLAVTVFVIVLLWGQDTETVGLFGGIFCLVQCIPLLASIYPTEKALRQTFDKDGNRKQN